VTHLHSPFPTGESHDAGLPSRAGIGFKPQHFDAIDADDAPPAFFEVHAENYLGAGGLPHAQLAALRMRAPISVHGVGLSLGGTTPPDAAHLARIAALLRRHDAAVYSEHLAWSTHDGRFFNDLLPLCYDAATLARVCAHIDEVQVRLSRRLLLENPSTYLEFERSTFEEADFLAQIVRRTGCALLLDINNVHVSCANNGRDVHAYLDALPLQAVRQVHLAGHAVAQEDDGSTLLIDDHGSPVAPSVWTLYAHLLSRIGPVPTLIEWDTHVPDYPTLRAEARQAQAMLDDIHNHMACCA
jgi:uncharacterized protein (UPF0276 family)